MPAEDIDQLLAELSSPEEPVRKTALLKLTKSQEIRAVPHLIRISSTDDSQEIRFLAKKALSYLSGGGNADKNPITARVLADPSREMRLLFLRTLAARARKEEAALLKPRLEEEKDPEVRAALVVCLGALGSKAEIPLLEQILEAEPDRRWLALEALGHISDPSGYPLYVRYARDTDPRVRSLALQGLKRLTREKLLKLLTVMSKSPRPWMVESAVATLSRLKDPEATEALGGFVAHENARLRSLATSGLHRMSDLGNMRAFEILAAAPKIPDTPEVPPEDAAELQVQSSGAFRDQTDDERLAEVLRIEQEKDVDGLKLLLKHADGEKEPKVKATLARVIGRLGDHTCLLCLEGMLRDPDDRVRANAIEAIALLTPADQRRSLNFLLKDPNNRVRTNAILALWGKGVKEVRDSLVSLANSADKKDRLSAVYAIHNIGEAAGTLLNPLVTDKDEEVRERAIDCQRLLGLGDGAAPSPDPPTRGVRRPVALVKEIVEELSSARIRISTEVKAKLAKDQLRRVQREMGEAYYAFLRGVTPRDDSAATVVDEINKLKAADEKKFRKELEQRFATLGVIVREKELGDPVHLAQQLDRYKKAESEVGEVDRKLATLPATRGKKLRILALGGLLLLVVAVVLLYVMTTAAD